MRRMTIFATAITLAAASLAGAQQRAESTAARPLAPRAGHPVRGRAAAQQPGERQQALVRRVRQAFNAVVRRQLSLTDDQAQQLQQVEQKYQRQRTALQREERQARVALAAAIVDTTGSVDQSRIAGYMDQLIAAQHRRADLLDAEQKELAGFLTPLQRAKYQGLREQLNRRVTEMRQQGARGRGAPPDQR
ncbi:MAG TPA: Spy/CpxP family protein refolding chaperone [Gemmatimonadaceae bacterium]|nr:Spy/CpxP family protein refolding chaperone [Gemmatimonadaceae bacterium]